ncbi:MAG: magnesium protoporphyrin IX methyltransferase [Pseudomonadota bacterium]
MQSSTYLQRREQLTHYFDRTAADAWKRLTSTEEVGRVRATVRAGREEIRNTLLDWLPADLNGARVLDAGCGTGVLSVEVARRGGRVVAVDVAPSLLEVAEDRALSAGVRDKIEFVAGDMLDPDFGRFSHVIAMDSLIHYRRDDIVAAVCNFTDRSRGKVLITFAPLTPALGAMHAVGRLIPKLSHRAPDIAPVSEKRLVRSLSEALSESNWRPGRTRRVSTGFYTSQALEVTAR